MLPRPDCCRFAWCQCRRKPSEVLAQSTRAFSCLTVASWIEIHARPPMVLFGVNCIPVDWLLNRKSRLKWACDADFQTFVTFSLMIVRSRFDLLFRGMPWLSPGQEIDRWFSAECAQITG